MLLISSVLVAYQHCSDVDASRHSIRNFLIKLLVSMVPLAILEFKVPKCTDPVGLFAQFSTKVMIMHVAFLALRWGGTFWGVQMGHPLFDSAMLLVACTLLPAVFGLRPTRQALTENLDVALLVATCISLAAL